MAGRGTEVGDAYISIHADGKRLRQEIRQQTNVAAREAAADGTKTFGQVWEEGLSRIGARTQQRLKESGRLSADRFAKAFEDEVEGRFYRIQRDLVSAFATGDFGQFERRFGGITEAVDAVSDALGRLRGTSALTANDVRSVQSALEKWAQGRYAEEATKEWGALAKQMTLAMRDNERFDAQRAKAMQDWGRMVERAIKENEDFDRSNQEVWDRQGRLVDRATREMEAHFRRIDRETRRVQAEAANSMEGLFLGRLRGSRNNFLNFIGLAFGGLERGLNRFLTNGLDPLDDAFANVFRNLRNLPGLIALAGRGLTAFGGFLSSIAASLVAAAGGIVIFTIAIGTAVSLISALTGVVTALASALAFALAGALLSIGPPILAFVGGIATLVTAFEGLEDRLDATVRPIREWFNTVQETVRANLFGNLQAQVEGLIPTLERFVGPLMTNTANALRTAADGFIQALNSPGVQGTLTTLGQTLPQIMGNLASVLGGLLLGILGFFAPISEAMVPISERLRDIAERFQEWANSAAGQNTIKDFFDRAWDAARSLWDLILAVGGALGTLFSQGRSQGQSMLDKITEIVNKFSEWANSEEGRRRIKDWLSNAREISGNLAKAIGAVSDAILRLDTPENRSALNTIIGLFRGIAGIIEYVGREAQTLQRYFSSAFADIRRVIGSVSDAVESLVGWLGRIRMPSILSTIGDKIASTQRGLAGLVPGFASGGIVTGPRLATVGEAGAEAIVPLNRPLSMVDPSVRAISALLQGKSYSGGIGNGPQKQVNLASGAVQVVTAVSDPYLAASTVLDRLTQLAKF